MKALRREVGGRHFGVVRTGRKEEIRRRIRLKIMLSEIAPGAPLDEEALAEEFGVSRTPIREICAHLVAEGSAEYFRGRGACVPPVTAEGMQAVFEAAATAYPALFTLAVQRADAFDLARLRGAVQAMAATPATSPARDTAAAPGAAQPVSTQMLAGRYLDFMEVCADAAQNEILARGTRQLMREECRIAIALPTLQGLSGAGVAPIETLIRYCGPLVAAIDRRDLDAVLTVLDDRLRASQRHHDLLMREFVATGRA